LSVSCAELKVAYFIFHQSLPSFHFGSPDMITTFVAIVDLELSNLLERRRVYAELGLLVEQAKEAQMSGALNQDMFWFLL